MKDIITVIAKALVDHPEEVRVDCEEKTIEAPCTGFLFTPTMSVK